LYWNRRNYGVTAASGEASGIKYLGIVKIETDAGITGYADLETQPNVARAIVEAPSMGSAVGFQGLRDVLVGEDPLEVERLWHKMYMASVYYGRRGAAMQVISGIDIALWDLVGKKLGQPIYKLLGGAYRDKVRAYASTLFRPTPEGMKDASRDYLDRGFSAIKFGWGVFKQDPELDVELVATARDVLGDKIDLLVDTGWYVQRTAKEAIQMVRRLEPFRPFLVEEPLSPEDYDGYAQLSNAVDTLIACGEQEATEWGFRALIEQGKVDVIQPDLLLKRSL
jgi:L-rhamnonate dehydratase